MLVLVMLSVLHGDEAFCSTSCKARPPAVMFSWLQMAVRTGQRSVYVPLALPLQFRLIRWLEEGQV